ncbi:MAG TPA: DUF4149 domain-containing protein [Ramlibacter sp.]|uniref:DUF4149 domain-containing protein n=1 Tax=Ramlibacter sp. TaxID=1917967 RepID=UPI002C796BCF|nr:DUF4149 domain-containing protein [Ramlibacter sp.]HVZ43085.1 DUF4149 domain-containing protein [Ramlibacter sp.]
MRERVPVFAAALWWGSLTAIGFMAVPLLFANLPSPAIAGQMAAKLFTAQTWMSVGCGMVLLIARGKVRIEAWALAGMILALLVEFAVAPRIVAKQDLALWHAVGSAMYGVQWICAGAALWKVGARLRHPRESGDPGPRSHARPGPPPARG